MESFAENSGRFCYLYHFLFHAHYYFSPPLALFFLESEAQVLSLKRTWIKKLGYLHLSVIVGLEIEWRVAASKEKGRTGGGSEDLRRDEYYEAGRLRHVSEFQIERPIWFSTLPLSVYLYRADPVLCDSRISFIC